MDTMLIFSLFVFVVSLMILEGIDWCSRRQIADDRLIAQNRPAGLQDNNGATGSGTGSGEGRAEEAPVDQTRAESRAANRGANPDAGSGKRNGHAYDAQ